MPGGASGASQGAQGAPLGNGTEDVSARGGAERSRARQDGAAPAAQQSPGERPRQRARGLVRKFRLLDTAAALLPGHRTSWCGRRPLGEGVAVLYHPEHASASYGGVAVCGSPWACPVCAPRIAAGRADEVKRGAAAWSARGGHLVMVTLTLRHQRLHTLKFLLEALNAAYRKIRGGGNFMRFKAKYGLKGTITSREITEGKNGWHPHLHALLFVKTYLTYEERREMRRWIYNEWVKQLKKFGLDATYEHGVSVQDIQAENAPYLTKVQESWSGANEFSSHLTKEAKRGNRTPAKLLALAAAGDQVAARRFVEYVSATKRKATIEWSNNLKKELLNEEKEKSDQDLAEETIAEAIELFTLYNWQWQIILKHGLRGELLAECCAGDIDTPVQFLAGWGITLAPHQLKYTFRCKNTPKGEGV